MIRTGTHKMGTPRMRAMTCSSCRSGAPSSTRQLIRTQANAAPPIPSGPAWKLKSYDVDQAVGKALQFFEANESGRMTRNNRARWRGNCYMNDGGRVDLVGGWHDAGDHLKLMFPMFTTVINIAWACLDDDAALKGSKYDGRSNWHWAVAKMLYGVRYLLKCNVKDDAFVVQIGEAEEDHKYCLRAELDDITPRTVYTVDRNHPGGDAVGMAAAAFAACAMALRKVSNKNALANKCMSRARKLYSAGKGMRVCYSDSIPECAKTYPTDNWQQFMMMGAAWMYRATEDKQYRQDFYEYREQVGKKWSWPEYSWGAPYFGAHAVMLAADGPGDERVSGMMDYFTSSHLYVQKGVKRTPAGLTFMSEWGSLRHAAGVAAIIAFYSRSVRVRDSLGGRKRADEMLDFAESQLCYALGATGRSFVIGFGRNPPRNPHHRGAALTLEQSGRWDLFSSTDHPTQNQLTGAMVGGPGLDDSYTDVRTDYQKNEVALDYNAALFVGLAHTLRAKRDE